jgi:hypothetical protein
VHTYVMYGRKELINIWLAFRILELETNFDDFICVICILCWYYENFNKYCMWSSTCDDVINVWKKVTN